MSWDSRGVGCYSARPAGGTAVLPRTDHHHGGPRHLQSRQQRSALVGINSSVQLPLLVHVPWRSYMWFQHHAASLRTRFVCISYLLLGQPDTCRYMTQQSCHLSKTQMPIVLTYAVSQITPSASHICRDLFHIPARPHRAWERSIHGRIPLHHPVFRVVCCLPVCRATADVTTTVWSSNVNRA